MRLALTGVAIVGAASCCCCGLDPDEILDVHGEVECREGASVPGVFAFLPTEPDWVLVCVVGEEGNAQVLWHGDLDGRVPAVVDEAERAMRGRGWVTTRSSGVLNERVVGLRGDRQLLVGVSEAIGPDHVVWLIADPDVDLDASFLRIAGAGGDGGDFDWD